MKISKMDKKEIDDIAEYDVQPFFSKCGRIQCYLKI
jgi:hypothetical protein